MKKRIKKFLNIQIVLLFLFMMIGCSCGLLGKLFDKTPPGEVNDLTAKIYNKSQVTLQWLNPLDDDYSNAIIFYGTNDQLDIRYTGEIDPERTDINDLNNGIEYRFAVQTVDINENISAGIEIKAVPQFGGGVASGTFYNYFYIQNWTNIDPDGYMYALYLKENEDTLINYIEPVSYFRAFIIDGTNNNKLDVGIYPINLDTKKINTVYLIEIVVDGFNNQTDNKTYYTYLAASKEESAISDNYVIENYDQIIDGEIKVSEENDIYNIEWKFLTLENKIIIGSYEGELNDFIE